MVKQEMPSPHIALGSGLWDRAGGAGIWPAFWMLPSEGPESTSGEGVYGHWPMSGEIDIMEAINNMDTTSAALHFGGPGQYHRQITASATPHLEVDKVRDSMLFT